MNATGNPSPARWMSLRSRKAQLAQRLEYLLDMQGVRGSNPLLGTTMAEKLGKKLGKTGHANAETIRKLDAKAER